MERSGIPVGIVAAVIRANNYVFRYAFSPGEINDLAIFEIFNDHGSSPESILWSEATSDRIVVSMNGEAGALSWRCPKSRHKSRQPIRSPQDEDGGAYGGAAPGRHPYTSFHHVPLFSAF